MDDLVRRRSESSMSRRPTLGFGGPNATRLLLDPHTLFNHAPQSNHILNRSVPTRSNPLGRYSLGCMLPCLADERGDQALDLG